MITERRTLRSLSDHGSCTSRAYAGAETRACPGADLDLNNVNSLIGSGAMSEPRPPVDQGASARSLVLGRRPPLAYRHEWGQCLNCGLFWPPEELDDGYCPDCSVES